MELLYVVLLIVGLLVFVHSLRLRGCLAFVTWMLAGMTIMALLLLYTGWLQL